MQKIRHLFTDPSGLVSLHKWLTIIWFIAAFPICIFLANSVPFLVFVSVYAVVTGHWATWQAARTEVEQVKTNSSCPNCGHDPTS